MLSKVFERFVDKAPVAVIVRGILERIFGAEALNALYRASRGQAIHAGVVVLQCVSTAESGGVQDPTEHPNSLPGEQGRNRDVTSGGL